MAAIAGSAVARVGVPSRPRVRIVAERDYSLVDVAKDDIKYLPRLALHAREGRRILFATNRGETERLVAVLRAEIAVECKAKLHGSDVETGLGLQVVGFDTETRPRFEARSAKRKVALIQIATASTCGLFRTSEMGFSVPPSLAALLEDEQVLKVGVGVAVGVSSRGAKRGITVCPNRKRQENSN